MLIVIPKTSVFLIFVDEYIIHFILSLLNGHINTTDEQKGILSNIEIISIIYFQYCIKVVYYDNGDAENQKE